MPPLVPCCAGAASPWTARPPMHNTRTLGHVLALITIAFWGTTYVSTKVLLGAFTPVEILLWRFLLALAALFLVKPKPFTGTSPRHELTMALAALCGICLYYLLENEALVYTTASNAAVIVCVAPCFTALLSVPVLKAKLPSVRFYLGFAMAMVGIALVSWTGASLEVNPLGDLLALLAALAWGFYAVLSRITANYGYPTILVTRRMFEYGLLFMIPFAVGSGAKLNLAPFADPVILCNMIFLGLGASALCFVTWNQAVRLIGPVQTSVYIYLTPVVTVTTAALILDERMTPVAVLGTVLTLAGLIVSESRKRRNRTDRQRSGE